MQARRHHLLLDCASGFARFRGVRSAIVVDVQYDEHTADPMEWRGPAASASGGSDRFRRQDRELGRELGNDDPTVAAPAELAASLVAARFDHTESPFRQPAPQIDVDWDPDEAPTRVAVGGDQLTMWKPSAAEPFGLSPEAAAGPDAAGDVPTKRFAPSLQAPPFLSEPTGGHARHGRSRGGRTVRPSPASATTPFGQAAQPARRQHPPLPSVLEQRLGTAKHVPVDSTLAGYAPEERQYFPGQTIQHGEPVKPARRRWLLPAVGGAVIALTSGGSAYWLFSRPASCDLVIETTPADARVTLDGKVLPGGQSPYRQEDLPLGQHQVLVEKAGYALYAQSFALGEHEDKHALTVRLTPEVKVASLAVSSTPAGAEIFVDGRSVGSSTPATVNELNRGQHAISLKLDGYVEAEQAVRVPEDAAVSITLVKNGEVGLVGLDGAARSRGGSREAVRQRRAEIKAARVLARYRERMGLPPDPATQALLALATDEETGAERDVAALSGEAADTAATPDTGTLQLNSRPWSEVYVDGEHVGHTPLRALALPTGRHTVRLENPERGVSKAFEIAIVAGRTVTQTEELSQ